LRKICCGPLDRPEQTGHNRRDSASHGPVSKTHSRTVVAGSTRSAGPLKRAVIQGARHGRRDGCNAFSPFDESREQ
jgi:hypothetical protein